MFDHRMFRITLPTNHLANQRYDTNDRSDCHIYRRQLSSYAFPYHKNTITVTVLICDSIAMRFDRVNSEISFVSTIIIPPLEKFFLLI